MVRVYTLSNLVLVHFAENFSLGSKCFQSSYCTKVGFPSLPSPFPFIGKGTEKRGGEPFPIPIVPRAFFIFRCIAIFIGILRGSLCGVERKRPVSLCECLCFLFFYFHRLLITTGYEIKVHKRWPDFRVIFHERFTAAIRWKTP